MNATTQKFLRNGVIGQAFVEYSLMIAFIGVMLIGVTAVMNNSIENQFIGINECFAHAGSRALTSSTACKVAAITATPDGSSPSDPNNAPIAAIFEFCSNLSCSFVASGSSDNDGIITSYAWNFGDGNNGTGLSSNHTYAAGTYTVTLTVTDNDGATGQTTTTVTVSPPNVAPTANMNYSCTSMTCSFAAYGSSDSDGTIASYAWNFGDGNSGTGTNASHTYTAGTYTVTLTVTDDDGATDTTSQSITVGTVNNPPTALMTHSCTDLICTFANNGSFDNDGSIVSYAWDFGDGNSGTGAITPHTYASVGSYTITLTVTDDDGATDTTSRTVSVSISNVNPIAAMTYSCTDLSCTFTDNGSSDSDGSIVSYSWNFGDSSIGTGASVPHTYAADGTYTVILTVTDDDGATDTASTNVTVINSSGNQAPTALMSYSCTELSCTFSDNGSSDSDGSIASYSWSFGDSKSGTGAITSNTYISSGTYTVTLTVTDNDGATGQTSQAVTVVAANVPPSASISQNCSARTCTFTSTSTDSDGSIVAYSWVFSEGGTATGSSATRTYSPGAYTVTLTVIDDDGATNSTTANVTITNLSPTAGISHSCTDASCTFNSNSSDSDGTVVSYSWDFGDSSTATGASTSHNYADGTYTATLTVTDNDGATASTTVSITISTTISIWIDDVDANGTNNGTKKWDLESLTVHVSSASGSVNGITVTINGASCTTDTSGSCTIDIPNYTINNNGSKTVAITSVTGTGIVYVPANNSDSDSDNVTVTAASVTINNPR